MNNVECDKKLNPVLAISRFADRLDCIAYRDRESETEDGITKPTLKCFAENRTVMRKPIMTIPINTDMT